MSACTTEMGVVSFKTAEIGGAAVDCPCDMGCEFAGVCALFAGDD